MIRDSNFVLYRKLRVFTNYFDNKQKGMHNFGIKAILVIIMTGYPI